MTVSSQEESLQAFVILLDYVLKLELHILNFTIEISSYIQNQSIYRTRNLTFLDLSTKDLEALNDTVSLITKYRDQISKSHFLHHNSEVHNQALEDVIEKIILLERQIRNVYQCSCPLKKLLINHFILKQSIDKTINLLITQHRELQKITSLSYEIAEHKIAELSSYSYPVLDQVMAQYLHITETITAKYPFSQDFTIFGLYMEKTTIIIDTNRIKYHNLQNSILQRILADEGDSSSNSFTDQEIKIIDLMEYLTAHLDFIPHVLKVLGQFQRIIHETQLLLQAKEKLLQESLSHLQLSEHHQQQQQKRDTNTTSAKFLLEIDHFVDQVVVGGTIGLSKVQCYKSTIQFLSICAEEMSQEISSIENNFGDIPTYARTDFIKSFDVFALYRDCLSEFSNFLTDTTRGDTNSHKIIDTMRVEFEELDEALKGAYFQVLEQIPILNLEEKIVRSIMQKV
ncbi:hypothetical protein LELG_03878 [Lodderomyces elongisporus NRRL YB-4239]|uniref:Autophagy-related protein 17 n=1 Tax=Lodderomyces elongisporus (strain ATCC 11503 / CBS 2605 / JCM 1781 / NBRC 1676 / NRRL YB-4239) TaxID=379508 RepID=A5E2P1_LODEL|nr:hypothetical protein LELG_03878 [Lodderomyces elongisporus NRRL YB-4239]